MKALVFGVLAVLVLGCGEHSPTPSQLTQPSPPPPPALTIVSGNGQHGRVGEFLAEPLAVRVTDPNGNGVAGVAVRWTIVAGGGDFGTPAAVTPTGGDGVAAISFRPRATSGPDGISVAALAEGVDHSPAFFTLRVVPPPAVPAEVFIPFGPIFDCNGGNDPSLFSAPEGTIPVGALVVWEYAPWLDSSCAARLRSVSVPPGGAPFELVVRAGERYGVMLDVAGDWVVQDMLNGGSVTLRVR
jgi:hypothetical protein